MQRGERIGIVGPNGAGKTTFLRVLLGELAPDAGRVVVGARTRVAYHDQGREALDPEQTVYEAAGGSKDGTRGEDFVELSGRRVALRDYLDDLLFPPSVQRMQVKALSGGERNRLLLARAFLAGANVLVLDEPTNDLDLVTLNVLERLLARLRRRRAPRDARSLLPRQGRHRHPRVRGRGEGGALRGELRDLPHAEGAGRGGRASGGRAGAGRGAAGGARAARRRRRDRAASPGGCPSRSSASSREWRRPSSRPRSGRPRSRPRSRRPGDLPEGRRRGGRDAGEALEQAAAEVERLYARWQELEAVRGA